MFGGVVQAVCHVKLLIAALVVVRRVRVPSLILGAERLIVGAVGPPGSDLLIKRRRIAGADPVHNDIAGTFGRMQPRC